jgi:hypothetical protein
MNVEKPWNMMSEEDIHDVLTDLLGNGVHYKMFHSSLNVALHIKQSDFLDSIRRYDRPFVERVLGKANEDIRSNHHDLYFEILYKEVLERPIEFNEKEFISSDSGLPDDLMRGDILLGLTFILSREDLFHDDKTKTMVLESQDMMTALNLMLYLSSYTIEFVDHSYSLNEFYPALIDYMVRTGDSLGVMRLALSIYLIIRLFNVFKTAYNTTIDMNHILNNVPRLARKYSTPASSVIRPGINRVIMGAYKKFNGDDLSISTYDSYCQQCFNSYIRAMVDRMNDGKSILRLVSALIAHVDYIASTYGYACVNRLRTEFQSDRLMALFKDIDDCSYPVGILMENAAAGDFYSMRKDDVMSMIPVRHAVD